MWSESLGEVAGGLHGHAVARGWATCLVVEAWGHWIDISYDCVVSSPTQGLDQRGQGRASGNS